MLSWIVFYTASEPNFCLSPDSMKLVKEKPSLECGIAWALIRAAHITPASDMLVLIKFDFSCTHHAASANCLHANDKGNLPHLHIIIIIGPGTHLPALDGLGNCRKA